MSATHSQEIAGNELEVDVDVNVEIDGITPYEEEEEQEEVEVEDMYTALHNGFITECQRMRHGCACKNVAISVMDSC